MGEDIKVDEQRIRQKPGPKPKVKLDVLTQDMVSKISRELPGAEFAKQDGWVNALVGLGKAQDKQRATKFEDYPILVRDELSRMYVGDGLGRRIIDVVADDMTREWLELSTGNEDINELLMDQLNTLNAENVYNTALRWKRLFGGAIIVIGAMDGQDLDQPLNIQKTKSVDWLKPIDMWDVDLVSSEWERDPKSAMFGKVVKFMVQFRVSGTGVVNRVLVHHSRVIDFHGETIPPSIVMGDQRSRYWGASILQSIWDALRNMGGVMSSVTNILYEFVIGKYKFENLSEMLMSGNEQKLHTRMEIINMSKSILNAVMLGKDEEYTRDTASVAGLADLIDRFMMVLSGVTGIPVTRLFGRSPGGLNATGESDISNYYDMIRSQQKISLKPAVLKLVQLLMVLNKTPEKTKVIIKFNSLLQLNEVQLADLEAKKSASYSANASADIAYITAGVLTAEDVAVARGFIEEGNEKLGGGENK